MKTKLLVNPEHVALLNGDAVAALLLGQIVYWNRPGKDGKTKLRVFKRGSRWLAKSALDWQAEIGLTPKRARRGIAVLKSRGLIETALMKFAGSPTTHIRLTAQGHQLLSSENQTTDLPAKAIPFSHQGKSITESTAEKTTEINPADKSAGKIQSLKKEKENEEKQNLEKGGGQKKEYALATLWKACVAKYYPDPPKALTAQEYGQLKLFRSKVGQHAPAALTFAVENWAPVVWKAKADKGFQYAPNMPHVGFLLAHHDVVMNLLLKEGQQTLQAKQKVDQQALMECILPTQVGANEVVMPLDSVHVKNEADDALMLYFAGLAKTNEY